MDKAEKVLRVFVTDPTLRTVLAAIDPKALQQAFEALGDSRAAAEVHFPSTGVDWGVVQAHARAAFDSRLLETSR